MISIHALREEGDKNVNAEAQATCNFYPRPPRGGRPGRVCCGRALLLFLSTPSARRATKTVQNMEMTDEDFYPRPPRGGRLQNTGVPPVSSDFYPRPPRGGRPAGDARMTVALLFLSTPSARRATTVSFPVMSTPSGISIHALREEGDARRFERRQMQAISIHALREEGDTGLYGEMSAAEDFYPRPPRGGRPH